MLKVSPSHTTRLGVFGWCIKHIYAESKRESWRSSEASTTIHKGHYRVWLFFKRDGTTKITGYSDNSHNIDVDDGRITTGFMFYLGTSPITWTSCKQPTVALSSCEAEFMAATEAAKQAIWLKELMAEIMNKEDKKVVLKIDNKSAIALTKNPVFHGRSKHILAKYHFI